jgi:hypothetical protein
MSASSDSLCGLLRRSAALLALVLWFLLNFTPLLAQDTRGQILGRVTDSSGAVLPGAKIRCVSIESGVTTTSVANETGDYVLPFLIPGAYNVSVEREGFRRFEQQGVIVQVDSRVTVNARLELGAATESVDVVAESPLVEAADAALSSTVASRSLEELPLKDGNPVMLTQLSPGVLNLSTGGQTRPFDNAGASAMPISGSRTGTNEYRLDGAPNTTGSAGNVAFVPPSGVVAEVKVQTSPFDASTGFSTGGTVNVSLKSGGKQVHGQWYHSLQNPVLNANSFFSNLAGLPRDNYRQNRWGGSASGPVYIPGLLDHRHRTFWMYGYEGIRNASPVAGQTGIVTVPTAAQRQGDYSSLLALGSRYQIYDPNTIRPVDGGHFQRDPFPSNVVPSTRINSASKAIADRYIPLPNLAGSSDGTNNYITPFIAANDFGSHIFRIDEVLSERNRFFVRGALNNRHQDYGRRFNNGAGYEYWRNNRGFGVDDAFLFSPSFLLNVRYNYTRYFEYNMPLSQGVDLSSLGFSAGFVDQINRNDPRGLQLPQIDITNYLTLSNTARMWSANDIHAAALAFTRIERSHTLTFGGEARFYRDTRLSLGRSSGQMSFGSDWTKGPLETAGSAPLGQSFAAFQLGLPGSGNFDRVDSYAQQYGVSGWYFQDAWKARSNLTLTFGIRWEIEQPVTERYNRAVRGFDSSTSSPIEAQARANYANSPTALLPVSDFKVRGGLTFAGVAGAPRQLWEANRRNFAPRFALAWRANARTVVRGGYGIFYDLARQTVDQSGFSRTTSLAASLDTGQTFIAGLQQPFPTGLQAPLGASGGLLTNAGQSITPMNTNLRDPYMQRWQLSVQRQLGSNTLAEIAYVGSRGNRMRINQQLNPTPAQYLSTLPTRDSAVISRLGSNVSNPYYPLLPGTSLAGRTTTVAQLLKPYSQFIGVTNVRNDAFSWYHAVQTRVEKRLSRGYSMTAAWTWSKLMEASSFLNDSDPLPTHTISDQDRTHRFVVSSIWELPVGRGRRWASSWRGVSGRLASGWQVQGIYQAQSGAPLSFSDVPFSGDFSQIALPRDQRNRLQWFNVNAGFERDTTRQFSYHLRTFPLRLSGVRTMGLNMWDLSALKNTKITEKTNLQFRCEWINALNHTHFSAPSTSATNSAFGTVTSTAQQPRSVQFGLKFLF